MPTDITTSTGSTRDSPSVTPPPLHTDSPPNGMVSFRCKTSGGSDGASPARRTLTKTLCAGVTPLCTAPLRTACDSPLEPRERQRSVRSDVELDKAVHRINPGGLHTNSGGNWNRVWREFFARNKTPTRQQILDQLAKMRKDFGLE
jgi:hypothetical protein